jgi:LPPG:FO 2-phospho-L-lactate transferase
MARALASRLPASHLTVIVNVGDDAEIYGVHVAADLDTVMYTLAGVEGPHGWGRRDDTWHVLDALERLGVDTTFRLGDADVATCLARTVALRGGRPLSEVTGELAAALGVKPRILPASDDAVRTRIRTPAGEWLAFQEYFVMRRHRDRVAAVEYAGAESARPTPGVLGAIAEADVVVIGPSNPPLSIWPILAIGEIRAAIAAASRVVGVSPLFRGKALKGPTASVMADLGLPLGNAGVAAAYRGLLTDVVIHRDDELDAAELTRAGLTVGVLDTRMTTVEQGTRFGAAFIEWLVARPAGAAAR